MQLQKFGIEIRKIGNVKNLYKDVDLVLQKAQLRSNEVNGAVQALTVAHALQKMLQVERHFDVCTIRNCAEMCQICIAKERMQVYQSIHCHSWNEMLPEYRETIIAMVLDDFRPVLNQSN